MYSKERSALTGDGETLPLPQSPLFGSGPCAKPPGWSLDSCQGALLGRSHRSKEGLNAIRDLIQSLRSLVHIPQDYEVILTPGSATGACEMAMWNLLGRRSVDVLCWDVFSYLWRKDVRDHLRLGGQDMIFSVEDFSPESIKNALSKRNPDHDFVFTWVGTTSGLAMNRDIFDLLPQGDGLVICDATAALMTMPLPWSRMDAISFSWQKALGGEASLGVLVLSPRAVECLESWSPSWPVPRLLRLKKGNSVIRGAMCGETINTPSMLLIQENQSVLDLWHQRGGLQHALGCVAGNNAIIKRWCEHSSWAGFLSVYHAWRAPGPVTLAIRDPFFQKMATLDQWSFVRKMGQYLCDHRAAFDIVNHPHECPAFRVWCGPSVGEKDIACLLPWLDRAFFWVRASGRD